MSVASRIATFAGSSKFLARHYYPRVTRASGDDFVFLNMGYEEDPPMALPLAADDEPNRYCIQLYHKVTAQVGLEGKDVLEVSCGHGGGASYVTRTFKPASYTGLDLNSEGVDFCRKRHQMPGLEFVQGDAENLPFPDQSFDAVINVEASSYYDLPRFFAEVKRVLRPGGHLLYADVRYGREEIAKWDRQLGDCPLRTVSERLISEQVALGLERNIPRYQELNGGRGRMSSFVLSTSARNLRSGEFCWRMYCFAKD
ncbi:MAG: phthiotriol/phenolphthiotriol dimycocerosates methyltransferase [Candidatus Sericytochromatia bacterium]